MDDRIKNNFSNWVGLPIDQKTQQPFILQPNHRRTDEPYNRFVIHRNLESECIYATCIPRMLNKLKSVLNNLSCFELFSSFGMNELKNNLSEEEAEVLGQGFGYTLTSINEFVSVNHKYNIVLCDDGSDPKSVFPKKFCCYIDKEVVSSAYTYLRDSSGLVAIDVETKIDFRNRGIGIAVVSEATKWLLENQYAVYYGANILNIASLHIAKKLGFKLTSQHIVA